MQWTKTKVLGLFQVPGSTVWTESDLHQLIETGKIPAPHLSKRRVHPTWESTQLPEVGRSIGFLPPPAICQVFSFFVTKGGVLKTSLAMNFARLTALHGLKTLVIGLDMQGDITTALGYDADLDKDTPLEEALKRLAEIRGLPDVLFKNVDPAHVIEETDLPTLFLIPETPELVALERALTFRHRREYWLHDLLNRQLRAEFDVIVLDCSPNWNQLITNALVASDHLISPLECKINNYRNLKMFRTFIEEFRQDLNLGFTQTFVPTRLNLMRRLSRDINDWYHNHLPGTTSQSIRESTLGEEAMAVHLSLPEYAPQSPFADEIKGIIEEIWRRLVVLKIADPPLIMANASKTERSLQDGDLS